MKKYIGIVAALAVVGLAFYMGPSSVRVSPEGSEGLPLPTLSFSPSSFNLNLPGLNQGGVSEEAFAVFEDYREFARTGNIEGIKSLSHQISPACSDPARTEECRNLMASVYYFTQNFQKEDFKHVYFDDRQIVMLTDFLPSEESPDSEPIRSALFFTRLDGSPKLLGIKFCLPDEVNPQECFETDTNKRDTDNNGWWDQVESFFR